MSVLSHIVNQVHVPVLCIVMMGNYVICIEYSGPF